jgi:hypothetical protein
MDPGKQPTYPYHPGPDPADAPYGSMIVLLYVTVLPWPIARTVADAEALDSGSTASAYAIPSVPTTTAQNSPPGRRSSTGQPGRTRPSGPMATTLPPTEADGAALIR